MHVQVLGAGCANCHNLESRTVEAIASLGITGEVEMVTDAGRIASMGVMSTPALVVDDRLVVSGRVPEVAEIASLIAGHRSSRGF